MIDIKDESQFREVIGRDTPTLVKFGATWCGKCLVLGRQLPAVEEALKDVCDVASIDADECKSIFEEYSVSHMPVLILFKNGKVVSTKPGIAMASTIADFVKVSLQEK